MDAIAGAIRARLADGREAEVAGLGTFEIVEKPGRPGRDPDTGAPIHVPSRRIVRFVPSPQLKQRLSRRT